MSVPAQPIAVTITVVASDGTTVPQRSASTVQSVPGGLSTIDISLQ